MHWVVWASSLLAFLLYYNTLDGEFVYDDRRAILTNPDVLGQTPLKALLDNDFWGTPLTDDGSHGSFRPLCVATYRLNHAISGLKPTSYHLFNVLLHCAATALVAIIAQRLLPRSCSKIGIPVAAFMFAAHPIHTEAVASIVGRADLAATNLFLLSFLLYMEHIKLRNQSEHIKCYHRSDNSHQQSNTNEVNFRLSCHGLILQIYTNFRKLLKVGGAGPLELINGHTGYSKTLSVARTCTCGESDSGKSELLQWLTLIGSLLLACAGTLCKEPAITVILLCIFYDVVTGSRYNNTSKIYLRSVCALAAGGVALFYWRITLTNVSPIFATADNPAAKDPSFTTRTLTFSYLPLFNLYILIFPYHLSFDWSMDAIPRVRSIFDLRSFLTLLFYIVISRVAWKALHKELVDRTDTVENKNEKLLGKIRQVNNKTKNKLVYTNSGKIYRDCVQRRGYHIPHREMKRPPCIHCRHPLNEEHSSACRAMNNNNYVHHVTHCACSQIECKKQKYKNVKTSVHVALLVFIALCVLPFIPASNLLFYVGFVVAERVLYLPSVGFCLLVGLGAGIVYKRWVRNHQQYRVFMSALLLLLIAMCSRTFRRNLDWKDEESLFRSAVHINPPKAFGNLGSILSAQGRDSEAEIAFQKALLYRPNMADVHYNLGILLQKQSRYEAAIKSFERAIQFRPSMALAYVNLGASLAACGRMSEAASILRAGAKVNGDNVKDRREHDAARVSALVQLAALHVQRSHWHKALSAYHEALQILPRDTPLNMGWTRPNILAMAGEMYIQLQHWPLAEKTMTSALAASPYDPNINVAYARLLAQNTTRTSEAEAWFKKAVRLSPEDPSIRDQFGQFLKSKDRITEAAEQFVAAARLSPKDSVRAAAAARALRDAKRCEAAERWYAYVVRLNPKDPQSHSNLGAILHLNGKYTAAAAAYRRALKLEPGDEITITNLNRVRTLMNKSVSN